MVTHDELILPICENKKVLDIGCVGKGNTGKSDWRHKKICEVASFCKGIDNQKNKVKKVKKEGYNVRYADAQDFELDEKFEVITLIEVIEHVSNPGLVLENIYEHLIPGGVLVVSTINPSGFPTIWRWEFKEAKDSTHVIYFSPSYFGRLANRYELKENKTYWLYNDVSDSKSIKGKFFYAFTCLLPDKLTSSGWIGIYKKITEGNS